MLSINSLFEQVSRRNNISPGDEVLIVLKKDQRTDKLTKGIVKRILSPGNIHTRGIKVRLKDGQVGRVQKILKKGST